MELQRWFYFEILPKHCFYGGGSNQKGTRKIKWSLAEQIVQRRESIGGVLQLSLKK